MIDTIEPMPVNQPIGNVGSVRPDHQSFVGTTHSQNVAIRTANSTSSPQGETLTISLSSPVGSLQTGTLNVSIPDSATTVLPTDYMNILDIVLDSSKLNLQGGTIDPNQAIVLAEVDSVTGNVIAGSQTSGVNTITLTPSQVNALNSVVTENATISLIENPHQAISVLQEETRGDSEEKDIILKDDNGDDIEFEDELDDDTPELEDSLMDPSSVSTDQTETEGTESPKAVKYKCSECQRPYVTKAAMKKHMQLVHNKELHGQTQKATSKCIHPGCDKIFYHRQKMIDHLKEAHGVKCVQEDLVFNSWDEFLLWKEKEEDANFVHFSKNSTHTNAKTYMLTNFTCQREGKAGYKYKGSQQKKYKDLVIGEKICPARMRARLDKPTGRVTVQYCKSHNHKLSFQDFLYRRMPDRLRNEIREKLASGMSSEEVYKELKSSDNIRENRGERFAPSKRQFVTLVNIKTIAKRMHIKETGPAKNFVLEPQPFAIQMQKLVDESYNPVILYKDQGSNIEIGPDEIDQITGAHDLLLIAIQTKEQREMFIKHGSKVVFIDITEALITPTQYIVTVKVLDEYNKGYPVAFLISNSRDETVLFYFFRELQIKVVDTDFKVTAVMTENSCNEYYAFRSVFGEDVKHLLCKWNLHRAWCQKIHEECAGDEALQQELYFIFVTMLEEQDIPKFESIATEFVNNYQARCANFITFFMSNYLSQPEVWASCYRHNMHADCDEILYGDRLHERIKKEIKNNRRVKSVDDLLDLCLKFEHEDYFNRGLNMMLNPPEPLTVASEHMLGMKIKSSSIVENYNAENCWLIKTSKRDPADLQSMKEEEFIVTWKADICEKDFCRERCLKLACFGLCGHLYQCSCESETVTPCRHIHKIHSMRIGVSQHQNDEEVDTAKAANDPSCILSLTGSSLTTSSSPHASRKEEPKLNLINQVHATTLPDPDRAKDVKVKKIKIELVKLYKFLESDNIQKYSLDFIEAGLKKVIEECRVIDSIGQGKIGELPIQGTGTKRKSTAKDLEEFELLVKSVKRKKVMGVSAPVIVEIEPNPAIYNTFRKRITGSTNETPEDRMLRLTKSKNITINIESDEKYRRTQSQQVTSTPDIIVAREGENDSENKLELLYEPDENDTEWTPRGARKGKKIKGKKRAMQSSSKSVAAYPDLEGFDEPLKEILYYGKLSLNVAHLKTLDVEVMDSEIEHLRSFIPTYSPGFIPDQIIDAYLHMVTEKSKNLYLTIEQMQSLYKQEDHNNRFWNENDLIGETRSKFIFVPWRNEQNVVCLFVVDLFDEKIDFYDPHTSHENLPVSLIAAHSTIATLLSSEIPFDNSRAIQPTWQLTNKKCLKERDSKYTTIRTLWFVHQIAKDFEVEIDNIKLIEFCKTIYDTLVGHCWHHCLEDNLSICYMCKEDVDLDVTECTRCRQKYHKRCISDEELVKSITYVCNS